MKAQEQDLEHADRINGWPAKIGIIATAEAWAKCLEVNASHDVAKIVILRNHYFEDGQVELGEVVFGNGFQHDVNPPEHRASSPNQKTPAVFVPTTPEKNTPSVLIQLDSGLFQRVVAELGVFYGQRPVAGVWRNHKIFFGPIRDGEGLPSFETAVW